MEKEIVLLLGRKGINVEKFYDGISNKNVTLIGGTNLDAVKLAFSEYEVKTVIMGAGIDIHDRLEIIEYIFEVSQSTSVHMKDWDSGAAGMMDFVEKILHTQ